MYYALIMAGGSGTRLWPLSRKKHPKQALQLVGDRTMFQQAVERLTPLFLPEQIQVVTRAEHVSILHQQTPELPAANFVVEPEGRGTAPAIGLAAIHLHRLNPQACMAVLTADHYIAKQTEFLKALQAAKKLAQTGVLVTLGITPSSPSTGFGYIQQGKALGKVDDFQAFEVARFTEKPDQDTAEQMVKSGQYSWNSGMFIWRVDRILEEFALQMPVLYAHLLELEAVIGTPDYETVLQRLWPTIEKQTIDYGIMERAQNVAVLPVEIGWTDVGSWGSLLDLLAKDENQNSFIGPVLGLDTHNTMIIGGQRLITTIGVQDLVVIDTPDALLICTQAMEQRVKEITERLKPNGYEALL
jgi:mannose-1-phosphate guanylyltransferase